MTSCCARFHLPTSWGERSSLSRSRSDVIRNGLCGRKSPVSSFQFSVGDVAEARSDAPCHGNRQTSFAFSPARNWGQGSELRPVGRFGDISTVSDQTNTWRFGKTGWRRLPYVVQDREAHDLGAADEGRLIGVLGLAELSEGLGEVGVGLVGNLAVQGRTLLRGESTSGLETRLHGPVGGDLRQDVVVVLLQVRGVGALDGALVLALQIVAQGDEVIQEIGARAAVGDEACGAGAGGVGAERLAGDGDALCDLALCHLGVALV